MINSCANGIAVVNIDNGYGAGYIATQINRTGNQNESIIFRMLFWNKWRYVCRKLT